MDSDPESWFTSSTLFKTSLLTISFTAVYFYRTENNSPFSPPVIKKSSEDKVVAAKAITPAVKKKKKKTIYMTFDDGPGKGTRQVIAIAKAENVPITFFLVGEHVAGSAEQAALFDSIRNNPLFEIANHSYTHADHNNFKSFYNNPDSVVADFDRCADSLNLRSGIARTPGRNVWRTDSITCTDIRNTVSAADSLKNNGYVLIGWDMEWHGDQSQGLLQSDSTVKAQIDTALAKNRTKTPGQLVLLAHDRYFKLAPDSASLHRLFIHLKASDEYDFDTVKNYPNCSN